MLLKYIPKKGNLNSNVKIKITYSLFQKDMNIILMILHKKDYILFKKIIQTILI
jgi:hypothetical protein